MCESVCFFFRIGKAFGLFLGAFSGLYCSLLLHVCYYWTDGEFVSLLKFGAFDLVAERGDGGSPER